MIFHLVDVVLSSTVIEKHVTFHRQLPGPDHEFAMTFEEFGEMIESVRNLEKALGDGSKEPSETELAVATAFDVESMIMLRWNRFLELTVYGCDRSMIKTSSK